MGRQRLTFEQRFWSKVVKAGPDECWNWTGSCYLHPFTKESTYGCLSYLGRRMGAHRASWMYHNQADIPEGMIIMHTCDNPKCVNPKHLQLGTMADNMTDKAEKGRRRPPMGVRARHARLNPDLVREIRALRGTVSQRELGIRYGVSTSAINHIMTRKFWKEVD